MARFHLFGKKTVIRGRCPECASFAQVDGQPLCAKKLDPLIDVRKIGPESVKRLCVPCPEAMTCDDSQPIQPRR